MIRMMKLVDLKPTITEDAADFGIENEDLNGQPYEDHEGEMARAQLLSIHKQAGELFNMIGEDENLEGWVQAKLTKAADYINAVYNNMQYEKSNVSSLGDGAGSPADADMAALMETLQEKWAGDAKVKKTGEHAGKTIEDLKSELRSLRKKSKAHREKGEKIPEDLKDQQREVIFAIRAKKGWPKGKGSTMDEEAPEGWEGTVKAMKDEPEIDNPWALAHWMKGKGYKSHKREK